MAAVETRTAAARTVEEGLGAPGGGQPSASGPRVDRLTSVDAMIAYDIPTAPRSGGGTRLAADVEESELLLLARAMTYKLASLGLEVGGAKLGVRATPERRAETMAAFRQEIAPLLERGALMTGPDLGTYERDFAGLPTPGGSQGLAATSANGVPVEELLTGCGVVSALATALGGDVRGRTVAIEGFGKMGASIARELAARGGRVVAVSTVAGCAVAQPGTSFSPQVLLGARRLWNDGLVRCLGVGVRPRSAIWAVDCDALVPGARPGALDVVNARRVKADVIVPVANVPYTQTGLEVLRERGIEFHADFVCSAGGAMAYLLPSVSGAPDVDTARAALDEAMSAIVRETLRHPDGPFAGAVERANRFLRSWLSPAELPTGPPIVPA